MLKTGLIAALFSVLLVPATLGATEAVEGPQHSVAHEFSAALGAASLNMVYFPVKLVCSLGGAVLGGVSGFLTGGDERTAEGVWAATVEGNYFVRPAHILGEEQFTVNGAYRDDEPDFSPVPGSS